MMEFLLSTAPPLLSPQVKATVPPRLQKSPLVMGRFEEAAEEMGEEG
jgi:hypothetical protein